MKNCLKRSAILSLVALLVALITLVPVSANPSAVTDRDDGLTVVNVAIDNKEPVQHLFLLIKTGSASDPDGKAGLTEVTNELLYFYFRDYTSASGVGVYTFQDFSCFHFAVTQKNLKNFADQLDVILRLDALMDYDFSNWLIYQYKTQPVDPAKPAYDNFAEMLYGPGHPYTRSLNPEYKNLNIGEINKWFRKIYRPNNFIIACSFELPDFFLHRPTGRDFKAPVGLPSIPPLQSDDKPALRYAKAHSNSSMVLMGFPGPKLGENDFFCVRLGELYLEEELGDKLRQESGLVYYVFPQDSALGENSAPVFSVTFETLPEETGETVVKAISVFKELAKNGIPSDRLDRILASEKKRLELQQKSLGAKTVYSALQAFYGQNWFMDSDAYLDQLDHASKNVAKVFADRLPSLKISVAGPDGVEATLKSISLDDLKPQKP